MRILAAILIVAMSSTTFLTTSTHREEHRAGQPDGSATEDLAIRLPVKFAIGGQNFPIGVLIYWFTTNLWSMGQQFYVIRNNPNQAHLHSRPRKS